MTYKEALEGMKSEYPTGKEVAAFMDAKIYGYESPISQIFQNIQDSIIRETENGYLATIQATTGLDINKEELIKALNYDRDQYNKGYNDALNTIKEKLENEIHLQDFSTGLGIAIALNIVEKEMKEGE